jgi:hypothetical protein
MYYAALELSAVMAITKTAISSQGNRTAALTIFSDAAIVR